MKKKLISLVLAASLTATMLAGCNQQAKPADSTKGGETKGGKVRVFTFNNQLSDDSSAKEFEKLNPGYTVDFEFLDYNNYFGKLMTYAASNDMPDVFWDQSSNYVDHVGKGLLTDLAPHLETPSYEGDQKWRDTVIPAVFDNARSILAPIEGTLKSKDYGVPFVMTTVAVLYDKNTFKKVGIEPPKNWQEFMSNNEKLKQAGYIPFSLVMDWIDWYPRFFWDQYLGEEIAKDPKAFDEGRLNFSDKRVQQALLDMKDMWDKGYLLQQGLTSNPQDVSQAFVQKKLAQFALTPSRLKYIVENAPKDMELSTFVFPGIAGKPPRSLGGSSQVVGISSSTKNFDAALRVAKYYTSKTVFALPALKYEISSLKDVKKDPSLDPIMKGYADAGVNGFIPEILVPAGITPQMREVFMKEMIPNLMLGKTNVDDISKKLQQLYKETYLDKKK